jgi:hypothetical protein
MGNLSIITTSELRKLATPYDIKSFYEKWSFDDINTIMSAEYSGKISELAQELNRSELAVIWKYTEIEQGIAEKIVHDYIILDPAGVPVHQFDIPDISLSDFNQDAAIIHMDLGQFLYINVRLIDVELRNEPFDAIKNRINFYMAVRDESDPTYSGGAIFMNIRAKSSDEHDPDRWGVLLYAPHRRGTVNVGSILKHTENSPSGIKKELHIIVE